MPNAAMQHWFGMACMPLADEYCRQTETCNGIQTPWVGNCAPRCLNLYGQSANGQKLTAFGQLHFPR